MREQSDGVEANQTSQHTFPKHKHGELKISRCVVFEYTNNFREWEGEVSGGGGLTEWAISWATMSETQYLFEMLDFCSSWSNVDSRYKTNPQFSIAPALKSGTATWSTRSRSNNLRPSPLKTILLASNHFLTSFGNNFRYLEIFCEKVVDFFGEV